MGTRPSILLITTQNQRKTVQVCAPNQQGGAIEADSSSPVESAGCNRSFNPRSRPANQFLLLNSEHICQTTGHQGKMLRSHQTPPGNQSNVLRTPESIAHPLSACSTQLMVLDSSLTLQDPILKCFQQKASRSHPKVHLSRCQNWFLVSHPSLLMSAAGRGEQTPLVLSNHREGQRAEIREASPAQGASVQRETKLMAFSLQKKNFIFCLQALVSTGRGTQTSPAVPTSLGSPARRDRGHRATA